uniref:VWFA domain-containing protein n=1 Tax=Paramormyrops kingsleyae TaxID=1676925 RepID=A0A3B3SMI6_9TELE
ADVFWISLFILLQLMWKMLKKMLFSWSMGLMGPKTDFRLCRTLFREDIVFLIDGSDDSRNRYNAIRTFMMNIIGKLDVDQKKDQVAVVQYSNTAATEFYLNTHTTKESILNAVRSLKPKGGRPQYTGTALQFVKERMFLPSAGSRRSEGAQQILVLVVSGRSRDSPRGPAEALKSSGVVTFALGSAMTDPVELQSISFQPDYGISTSLMLENKLLLSRTKHGMDPLLSFTCCVFSISRIVDRDVTGKDVVFLLDGSDGTRNGFPAMRDFVQRVVDKLKVSVVQYSGDPTAHFYLNTYSSKNEILNAVRSLRHKSGRAVNTGTALQFIRDNILTAPSGSRRLEGVPQILILLSGAKSTDNVDAPAAALKELGVLTFGIGTRNADSLELQKISYKPRYAQSRLTFYWTDHNLGEYGLCACDQKVTSSSPPSTRLQVLEQGP